MKLLRSVYDELKVHSYEAVPYESCGVLMIGEDVIHECWPGENVAEEPLFGYRLKSDLDLLACGGVYHSHPHGPSELSDNDKRLAVPGLVYLVIGLGAGLVMQAWTVDRAGEATNIPLEVVENEAVCSNDL